MKAVNDTLFFAEETITAGKQRFELNSGQKESFLLTDEASHASERAVRAILSGCKTFQFHDTSSEAHIRSAANMDNNRFLMSDGGNAATGTFATGNFCGWARTGTSSAGGVCDKPVCLNRRLYSREMHIIIKGKQRLKAADKCYEVIM